MQAPSIYFPYVNLRAHENYVTVRSVIWLERQQVTHEGPNTAKHISMCFNIKCMICWIRPWGLYLTIKPNKLGSPCLSVPSFQELVHFLLKGSADREISAFWYCHPSGALVSPQDSSHKFYPQIAMGVGYVHSKAQNKAYPPLSHVTWLDAPSGFSVLCYLCYLCYLCTLSGLDTKNLPRENSW